MNNKVHEHDTHIERAILVSLELQKSSSSFTSEYSLQELIRLAETAGVEVLESMQQKKGRKDPKWFIGKGKVTELKERLDFFEANTAIFDQELSGAQVRNLEAALDVKIIDRTQLILDIFAQRANTREGRLQVELAQLSYLLPRLSGQGKNLSRLGGGIGTRGPGESQLEIDRRHIRNRINELKNQLKEVVRHRSLHRERRKKTGVYQVALVGYTNAGKSTLLKKLTGADTYIENQLFATLDLTSRTLELPMGKEVILTDTVGFIQQLPHDLVAAFRATLEEVNEADLIIHVVDSSAEMRLEQMQVVNLVLEQLGAHGKDQITLFNKNDLSSSLQKEISATDGPALSISAYNEADLNKVKLLIQEEIMGKVQIFQIPIHKGDVIAMVHRVGEVIEQEVVQDFIHLKVRVDNHEYEKTGYALEEYKGGQ